MSKVEVINKKTRVASTLTQEQYDKVKNDPNWYNTFEVKPVPQTPKEVQELQQKQSEAATEKTTKADPKK